MQRQGGRVTLDELAQVKTSVVREKEDKIQKLSSSVKELKQTLTVRDQEVAQMRKQLSSASIVAAQTRSGIVHVGKDKERRGW